VSAFSSIRPARARRETLPVYDEVYGSYAPTVPRPSFSEAQIIAMLEAGIDPLTVVRAIRAGNHLHWRPDAAAEEAA
jgi:hypothetical protein